MPKFSDGARVRVLDTTTNQARAGQVGRIVREIPDYSEYPTFLDLYLVDLGDKTPEITRLFYAMELEAA